MAISQSLQQKLQQKLSPLQIQLMKLISVPTQMMEERIKEELEENPALEMEANDDADEKEADPIDEELPADETEEPASEPDDEPKEVDQDIDVSEYIMDDEGEIAEYKLKDDNYPEMDDKQTLPIKMDSSFFDMLLDQLSMIELDEKQAKIAEQVVGSLEDDGYLRRDLDSIVDDLAFRQNIFCSRAEIEAIIKKVQQFDPPGICARDLRECLLIQLKRKEKDNTTIKYAIEILEHYYVEFIRKHFDKIMKGLGINEDELKEVVHVITKLNPKPGGNIGSINKAETYIVPDFYITSTNGTLELSLNSRNAPTLKISEGYREMMREYDKGTKNDKRQKEAVMFIKQKIDSAKWFIDMIQQRQRTLLNTMGAIMQIQEEFFLTGDILNIKPMILKDISAKTDLDISTISRVANSKFVQTEFGTFKLKYFFSESLPTDSGEEVSTIEVKEILTNIIAGENKHNPYNDDELMEQLNAKGYNIARRTVAKYREMLNLPVARLRREI